MFVCLKLRVGLAVRKLISSSFVSANDEVRALDNPPTNAVVGYLPAKRAASAFASRAILCWGVSFGSTCGMPVAWGSTAVIRATQSLSSSSARSCTLASVFCEKQLNASLITGKEPGRRSPPLRRVFEITKTDGHTTLLPRPHLPPVPPL